MSWWDIARRPFFRITQGHEVVEGTKLRNGFLHLVIKFGDESISIKCSESNVEKLREWLCEQYPRGKDGRNILKLHRVLSVREDAPDPEGSPGNTK